MSRPFCVGLLICAAATLNAAPPVPSLSQAQNVLGRLPLRFEANQGQWKSDVRFGARAGQLFVAMTDRGPSLQFAGHGPVDLSFAGGNPSPRIEPLGLTPTRVDYYLGSRDKWHTGIRTYSRLRYSEVYAGVDAVYYGNPNRLEYDFMLQPGADARAIRMDFRGAQRISITSEGDLEIQADGGSILQKKPVVSQDGRAISARYVLLGGNVAGFKLGRYNHAHPLVIDPQLLYSTYVGGSANDSINAVKLDPQGRLYLAGATQTSDLTSVDLINGPAYQTSNAALSTATTLTSDIFLAILDTTPAGDYNLIFLTYIGGSGVDIPYAIAVDAEENVYLTGSTTSANFPIVGNAFLTTYTSNQTSAFVLELSPAWTASNELAWSTFLSGTTGDTVGRGIDVDSSGNVYVIGTTRSSDFPVTSSAYGPVRYGPQDAFITKFNPNTTAQLYSTYLGGELDDDGRAIAVAPNGLVYFAATTDSTQFPMEGNSYQNFLSGNVDGNVLTNTDVVIGIMDLTQSGEPSLLYSTYIGGTDNDEVRGIAFDAKGNLLLTGYALSADFPVTPDAMQPQYNGNGDAFVMAVNPNAPPSKFIVYSTYLGGSDGEVGYAVAADAAGYIYVTGYTLSADFPVVNAVQPGWGQGVDVFVCKLLPGVSGPAGLSMSTYFGGASVNWANSLAVGTDGRIYVGGVAGQNMIEANSADGKTPVLQGYGGGSTDGFVFVIGQ